MKPLLLLISEALIECPAFFDSIPYATAFVGEAGEFQLIGDVLKIIRNNAAAAAKDIEDPV